MSWNDLNPLITIHGVSQSHPSLLQLDPSESLSSKQRSCQQCDWGFVSLLDAIVGKHG